MTMHAQQIVGAQVTSADGQVVGTVEQVFNDDVDGTPVWARIKAGRRNRFIPLGGSKLAGEALTIPFETQRIVGGPEIAADQHMSAEQAEQLTRYYGLTVPAQAGDRGRAGTRPGTEPGAQPGTQPGTQPGRRADTQAAQQPGRTAGQQAGQQGREGQQGAEWLIRAEERISVATESLESGRVRIHKYVDVEPVEQAVRVSHEEYEVERVPITEQERISGELAEGERELILHEERAVLRKEAVPVERVRLVIRKVEEERTIRDEVRRERIEVEPAGTAGGKTPGNRR